MLQTNGSILKTKMAEAKEYDLENPQHLVDFLIDANIRLVRYEYLRHLAQQKRLWPRRQEAEHETFKAEDGSMRTALATIEEYKKQHAIWVFSVSHCWEAKQHPDPFGFQARELLSQFGHHFGGVSCFFFIDFMCLPQYYRTPDEQVFFKKAMANMHVLYAHASLFHVFRLEKLADERAKASPPDFIHIYYEEEAGKPGSGKFGPQPFNKLVLNDTPYHERGWCEAEKQWMSTKVHIRGFAPMTPARFQECVERGHQNLPDGLVLKFTHRSDEEIVMKLQEKIFVQQASRRRYMDVLELPESELLLLAESLPHFINLEELRFGTLEIGETSAVALIAGLKSLRHLKEVYFGFLCHIEWKAAKVLAQGLSECQFAGGLEVYVRSGFGPTKLQNQLRYLKRTGRVVQERFLSRLVRFWLGRLPLQDLDIVHFTIKTASGVEEGSKVGWLGRQLAKISSCKKRATNYSPPATPDAHVVAHV